MRRYAAVALLLGALSGCFNLDTGPDSGGPRPLHAQGAGPPIVPGVQGPYGTPVAMVPPYSYNPPSMFAAQQMMQHSVPMSYVQANGPGGMPPNMPSPMMPGGTILSAPGMPGMPGAVPGGLANPTTSQMLMPGPRAGPGGDPAGDIQLAQYMMNPAAPPPQGAMRTQVRFLRPIGMQVSWYAQGPDGTPMFSPTPIETPGKYNFVQGARYRLKLTNIPGRPGLELYPTLEVEPANHKVEAFLAHSSVPVEFTDEDFKQVAEGNYIVKVIYLPDPQFQDVAGTGTDEIVSTRLEPGQDPIQEAMRRGSVLLIIRMGNIDQEAPNTPPLTQPGPTIPGAAGGANAKPGPTMPGILTTPLQVPYWGLGPVKGPVPLPYPVPPPPPGMPPGMMPPGMMPPGGPQGNVPPGGPQGSVPPGGPQGNGPQGAVPPAAGQPSFLPPGSAPGLPGAVPPAGAGLPNKGPAGPPSVPSFGPNPAPGSTPFFPNLLPSAPPAPPAVKGASAPSTPPPITPVSASSALPPLPPMPADPAAALLPPRSPMMPDLPRP